MKCLVLVRFLPGGSLPPEEFFRRLNTRWQWLEGSEDEPASTLSEGVNHAPSIRSAVCLADYESIEQLTIDLAIMPGAGISSVEVVPIAEEEENEHRFEDLSSVVLPMKYNKARSV
jgi:hypothetical protein